MSANQTVAAENSPMTLNDRIDTLFSIREQRSELARRDKELKERFDRLKMETMEALDDQDVSLARGNVATVSITEDEYPGMTDFDEFTAYLVDTGNFHLINRSVGVRAWREMHQAGEAVPGVEPVVKRDLSLRKR